MTRIQILDWQNSLTIEDVHILIPLLVIIFIAEEFAGFSRRVVEEENVELVNVYIPMNGNMQSTSTQVINIAVPNQEETLHLVNSFKDLYCNTTTLQCGDYQITQETLNSMRQYVSTCLVKQDMAFSTLQDNDTIENIITDFHNLAESIDNINHLFLQIITNMF